MLAKKQVLLQINVIILVKSSCTDSDGLWAINIIIDGDRQQLQILYAVITRCKFKLCGTAAIRTLPMWGWKQGIGGGGGGVFCNKFLLNAMNVSVAAAAVFVFKVIRVVDLDLPMLIM